MLNSANILVPNVPELSLEALLALLNSNICSFIYQILFGQIKILRSNLLQLKVPRITPEQDNELRELVLAAEAGPNPGIVEKINKIVFEIYDLSENEASVIRKHLEK